MRLSARAALILACATLGACASTPPAETRVFDTTDLAADRILGDADACGYAGVRKTLGVAEAVTVTIIVPAKADPRYRCLENAMAARGEGKARPAKP